MESIQGQHIIPTFTNTNLSLLEQIKTTVRLSAYEEQLAFNGASDLHEEWRKLYQVQYGNVPRMKKLSFSDEQVDINQPFKDLHPEKQEQNLLMAQFIAKIIKFFKTEESNLSYTPIIYYELIHDYWLELNSYARGTELDVPFTELPVIEQQKDINVFDVVFKHYSK